MNDDLAILTYTDNHLPERFAECMRMELIQAACIAGDIPIVCISQKHISRPSSILTPDWTNICLGPIGRSWRSIYQQIIAGCQVTTRRYVALCEHDVVYPPSHFNLRPRQHFDGLYDQHCHRLLVRQRQIQLCRGGRSMGLLIADRQRLGHNLSAKLEAFRSEEDFRGRFEPGKGEIELGLPAFRIEPGAGTNPIINICNHGYNISPKAKRVGDFTTDRLPDGRTIEILIEQWNLPVKEMEA